MKDHTLVIDQEGDEIACFPRRNDAVTFAKRLPWWYGKLHLVTHYARTPKPPYWQTDYAFQKGLA